LQADGPVIPDEPPAPPPDEELGGGSPFGPLVPLEELPVSIEPTHPASDVARMKTIPSSSARDTLRRVESKCIQIASREPAVGHFTSHGLFCS
jgi:hypothetical protein